MARSPSGTGAADTVDEAGSTAATALEPGPTVVLLVAHGSRNPAAGVEHERLCTAGQQQLDDDVTAGVDRTEVRPAYLEIAAPVPATTAHDVHPSHPEGVRVAHDGADVEVVLPVLDRHLEREAVTVEVRHDGLDGPVAVAVRHVATVTLREQLRVEVVALGPGARVRADADLGRIVSHGSGP